MKLKAQSWWPKSKDNKERTRTQSQWLKSKDNIGNLWCGGDNQNQRIINETQGVVLMIEIKG